MSLISFSPLQDGVTSVNAAATNTPLSTIYNDYNGNITDANIAANAAIAGSKISLATTFNPYKFSVYRNSAFTTGSPAKVQFDTELFDTGSNFDSTTNYRFIAPVSGFYFFSGAVSMTLGGTSIIQSLLYKNGSLVNAGLEIGNGSSGGTTVTGPVSALLQLSATDYVEMFAFGAGAAGVTGSGFTYLHGFFLSAT